MLIDVEVPLDLQRQIEGAVPGEELEHVIEEADAGADVVTPASFDRQLQADRRFARVAFDQRAAHTTSSKAGIRRSVSATRPAVMRMQPSQPASRERSRTRIPRSASAATMAGAAGPTRTRTKLARLGHDCSPSRAHAAAIRRRDSSACATYQSRYSRSATATGSAAAATALRLYGGTISRIGASVSGCAARTPARSPASP